MRPATPSDLPTLLDLMAEFYSESGYVLERERAAGAFEAVLEDERLGRVWMLQSEGRDVGYVVITYRFAMEHAGLAACIDDLYVRPRFRNQGLSTAALLQVKGLCEQQGVRALTVEVAPDNGPAQAVYRHLGLVEAPGRQLLTLSLAAPAHAV